MPYLNCNKAIHPNSEITAKGYIICTGDEITDVLIKHKKSGKVARIDTIKNSLLLGKVYTHNKKYLTSTIEFRFKFDSEASVKWLIFTLKS